MGVVEEHNIIGGLNSAIAEWKSNQQLDTKGTMLSFATRDEFRMQQALCMLQFFTLIQRLYSKERKVNFAK